MKKTRTLRVLIFFFVIHKIVLKRDEIRGANKRMIEVVCCGTTPIIFCAVRSSSLAYYKPTQYGQAGLKTL